MDKKEVVIELEVKVKTLDPAKGQLVDSLAASAKLTKADAGRIIGHEDVIMIEINPCDKGGLPKVTAESHSKLTKADAGLTIEPTK
jgi:hypothetical protein